MSLYEYVSSGPAVFLDPLGLKRTEWWDAPGYKDGRKGTWHHKYEFYFFSEPQRVETRFTIDGDDVDNMGQCEYQRRCGAAINTLASETADVTETAISAGMVIVCIFTPGPDDLIGMGLGSLKGVKVLKKIGDKWYKVLHDGTEKVLDSKKARILDDAQKAVI